MEVEVEVEAAARTRDEHSSVRVVAPGSKRANEQTKKKKNLSNNLCESHRVECVQTRTKENNDDD